MLTLLGIFLVIVSLLLFSYFQLKANEDDLNRPSFFNSKFRKFFLLSILVLFFISGESLLIIEGFYNWTWFLPLAYFVAVYFARYTWKENLIVTRVLKYYKIFASPDAALPNKDRFFAPIGFMLTEAKLPADFFDKARKYVAKRTAEGKIKDVKDLPNEAWTILACANKGKIEEGTVNKISESKINYYYEEIYQDKEHNNFTKTFLNWLWQLEAQFERLFKNFSFVCLPRPDFTEEEVQLANAKVCEKGKTVDNQIKQYAVFPAVNWEMAKKFGWVANLDEYCVLAALEFQRRFPEHKFSKQIKKQHKYTNDQLFEYAQNWQKLDFSKIKLFA